MINWDNQTGFHQKDRLKPFHQCLNPEFPARKTFFNIKIFNAGSAMRNVVDGSARKVDEMIYLEKQTSVSPE